ncbi:hypothetical protein BCR34DRAFT_596953 [Clohesyomyces aquaticus]|uniref:Uncharacterized protein n=1 Tax=Clohesyomyces aquaticus TaxID=1231657 RepID=A0A1Y2A4Q8_9PLEO|nr:hypothetical protein BCR34DRAFT_596953 [Clohesyomyces aquaticus]
MSNRKKFRFKSAEENSELTPSRDIPTDIDRSNEHLDDVEDQGKVPECDSTQSLSFAQRFRIVLPQELRDMVYDFLSHPLEDIVVRRSEVNHSPVHKRTVPRKRKFDIHFDPSVVGHDIAMEVVDHYYRRTLFVVQDVDDLINALDLDLFRTGQLPREHINRVRVDIRTHCHEFKASQLKGLETVYQRIGRNLHSLLELKNYQSCKLHLRIRTWGGSPRIHEYYRTIHYLRGIVKMLKNAGIHVFVEHVPIDQSRTSGSGDLTSQFDLPEEDWVKLQKVRLEYARKQINSQSLVPWINVYL